MKKELLKSPFFYYFRRHPRAVLTGITALAITNVLDALPPLLIGRAIDAIAGTKGLNEVLKVIAILFAVVVGLALARFSWRMVWGYFSHTSAQDLHNVVFRKFMKLGQPYLHKHPVGELVSLVANDVSYFRMALGPGVILLLDAATLLLILPPLMISISPEWTWKTLILLPVVPFLMVKLTQLVDRYFEAQQARFSELSGFAQEIVAGIKVIKGYGQEDNRTAAFNRYSSNYEKACNRTAMVDASFVPAMGLFVSVGSFILLIVGAPEVMSGAVTIGGLFAFYQYIERMVWPVSAIGFSVSHLQQGRASFSRIRRTLEEPLPPWKTEGPAIEKFESLEFRDVSFTHPERSAAVLDSVSFTLAKGETLGVIGPTGSGKSTLVDLLTRMLPTDSGMILINGIPHEQYPIQELRRLIGVVPQEAFLFNDKIRDNIAFGAQLSQEEMRRLLDVVDVANEIEALPEKHDSLLGERGVNLSGGQKQRLTIARALARNSKILVLDDSLSAVDNRTERKILRNLRAHWPSDLAVIMISHRVDSMRLCDKVLVLNDGRVDGFGTHEECLKSSEVYSELARLQASAEEANVLH